MNFTSAPEALHRANVARRPSFHRLRWDLHLSGLPRQKWIFPWLGLYYDSSWRMEDNFRRTFSSVSSSRGSLWARSLRTGSGTGSPRCFKWKRKGGHGSSSHVPLELSCVCVCVCVHPKKPTQPQPNQPTATNTYFLSHIPPGILTYLLQLSAFQILSCFPTQTKPSMWDCSVSGLSFAFLTRKQLLNLLVFPMNLRQQTWAFVVPESLS